MSKQNDGCCRSKRDISVVFDGIDRSVAPESLLNRPAPPLTLELLREGFRRMLEMANRPRQPDLLPADLFEVVTKYGWGSPQTLAVIEERYRRQFGDGR